MNEKKTYVKPAIEGVYLLPDEAVLGACKSSNQNGLAEPCTVDGVAVCSFDGS